MPLWQIYHPSNAFSSAAERQQLSAAITSIYVAVGLPPFYVVVVFREQPADTVFVGGEARPSGNEGDEAKTFIRIVVKNIARRLPDGVNDRKTKFLQRVDAALHPFIAAKGWDWEYHVEETERSLWKMNGMYPPLTGSAEEREWFDENKAVEWSGAYEQVQE